MGEKKSEQLKFIPAQVKMIEIIGPQYSCRHCEKTTLSVQIRIAPVPLVPIPKSIATASLLSQIITGKYQYSLPCYFLNSHRTKVHFLSFFIIIAIEHVITVIR